MIAYLVAYVCTTAAMDDCQVYVADTWDTIAECRQVESAELARLQTDYRNFYVRVECETE